MTGDITPYLNLVTSEHQDKPNFIEMISAVLQPLADDIAVLQSLPSLYDLDNAAGAQLDVVGQWVGASRNLNVPLVGVYFAFDTAGVGFDQGTWLGPFDPTSGLISLPDDTHLTYLRARIANNVWDGTIPGAYATWDVVFAGTGITILIQDLGTMHMLFAVYGSIPDAVTYALITSGLLDLKPAGVKIDAYLTPVVADTPFFGFDVENTYISGFDVGAFGKVSSN